MPSCGSAARSHQAQEATALCHRRTLVGWRARVLEMQIQMAPSKRHGVFSPHRRVVLWVSKQKGKQLQRAGHFIGVSERVVEQAH